MTAKMYLRQLQNMKINIRIAQGQIEELKHQAVSIGAIRTDIERVQSSHDADALASKIAAYVDKEIEYAAMIEKYMKIREHIISQILEMDDARHKEILFKRYVEEKKLTVIAKEMHYEEQSIRKLHGHALIEFQEKYLSVNKNQQ